MPAGLPIDAIRMARASLRGPQLTPINETAIFRGAMRRADLKRSEFKY
jgi:hypothetical protein